MTSKDFDAFRLGTGWGQIIADATLDQHDEPPRWLLEVFHAVVNAVDDLPDEYRLPVADAAITAWVNAGGTG